MTRTATLVESVMEDAKETRLDNDITCQDNNVIKRLRRLEKASKLQYWRTLRPNNEYLILFHIFLTSAPMLGCAILSPPARVRPLSSKTAVIDHVVSPFLKVSVKCMKLIHECLYGRRGDDSAIKKKEQAIHEMDIFGFFLIPDQSYVWDDDGELPAIYQNCRNLPGLYNR